MEIVLSVHGVRAIAFLGIPRINLFIIMIYHLSAQFYRRQVDCQNILYLEILLNINSLRKRQENGFFRILLLPPR